MTKKIYIAIISALILVGCKPAAYTAEDLFLEDSPETIAELTADGTLYHLQDFKDKFMTEDGNFMSDSSLYRTRSKVVGTNLQLFSIDTLPSQGEGIYIMGRITTDDYGGNYYKSIVIQEIVDGEQQALRLSVDIGSAGGVYNIGQKILIRCNGLAIGRYSNQPQLCIPSYNNNTLAYKAEEKTGWAAGRIPGPTFRKVVTMIGIADKSQLVYEDLTMDELYSKYLSKYQDIVGVRRFDGRLVRIKDIHFTGEYADSNGSPVACNQYSGVGDTGDPELDEYANVLAPTTKNVGYPQSRFVTDEAGTHRTQISCSEFCKFANYYIPSHINEDYTEFNYAAVKGYIEGILGYYADNGGYAMTETKWSITPRDLSDFHLIDMIDMTPWQPKEFSKSNYPIYY